MKDLFVSLLSMNLSSSLVIAAAVLAHFFKAPKRARCALWACAAVRMMIPFSVESVFSLVPEKMASEEIREAVLPAFEPAGAIYGEELPPLALVPESGSASAAAADNLGAGFDNFGIGFDILGTASAVWLLGVSAMLIYLAVCCVRVRLSVREAVRTEENIYICDRISDAFVFGLFRPKIYISSGTGEEKKYIIDHEKAHIKRLDHLWKPLGFLLLSVYWFNPLCWIGYVLFCGDIELACDEKAIKNYDEKNRLLYSEALLKAKLTGQNYPLSFGGSGIKERVKNVLNYKKPTIWAVAASAVLCGAVAVCFMTNPVSSEKFEENNNALTNNASEAAPAITSDEAANTTESGITKNTAESTAASETVTSSAAQETEIINEGLLTPEEAEKLDESVKGRLGYLADADGNILGYVPPIVIDGKISFEIDEMESASAGGETETGIELKKPDNGDEYAGYIWDGEGNIIEYVPREYYNDDTSFTPSNIDIISEKLSEIRTLFLEDKVPYGFTYEENLTFYVSPKWTSILIPAEMGTPAYAVEDGTVVMAEYDGGKGLAVCVENTDGESIYYTHLSEMAVENGDTVVKGQVVGYAGTTGLASYPLIGVQKTDYRNTES